MSLPLISTDRNQQYDKSNLDDIVEEDDANKLTRSRNPMFKRSISDIADESGSQVSTQVIIFINTNTEITLLVNDLFKISDSQLAVRSGLSVNTHVDTGTGNHF